MIYTDGVHLVSDTSLQELHAFARKIGLKRAWFQDHKRHPHYDLTTDKVSARALKVGAVKVSAKELLKLCTANPK